MKLRFGNSFHLIVGDFTFSPWVSLLLLISFMTMTLFPAGAHSQGQSQNQTQEQNQQQSQSQTSLNPTGVIEIQEGGELWIEGSASIVDYTCRAEELSGNGNIENISDPEENVRGHGNVAITVSVPVRTLECGKRAMNKDMYEALKSKKFPNINYRLLKAELETEGTLDEMDYPEQTNGNGDANWMNIKTTGILEIAGVKDTTVVHVKGQLLDRSRFQVKGSKEIDMRTFDIKPPTALMGLIKASNELTVHFNVTVHLKDQ
ncbi:YceI family protein [Balneolaceae bacterium YR4-1]|uniref:YceI family protein n=1 Tax=Halalkalibaculum roseum TaxID=2709311 RepID=A0A6M1SX03_9BACT|nr:YceI family protein [Halalkalibaculum roseum]NGP77502.1 YceI family protein [Halalkalibaculum roseum]